MPFTHLRGDGSAHMVDVSGKQITTRTATAEGMVVLASSVVQALRDTSVPKGDVLAVARIAGIQGAKRAVEWIPLAHPVRIDHVAVDLEVLDDGVRVRASVTATDRTGIEMEALTAVSAAALTVIDMTKSMDRHARITDVRVVAKAGGRSGSWQEA